MDGGGCDPARSAYDAPRQSASAAPCHTRSRAPEPRGPSAESVIAVRSAACRNVKVSGHARPSSISVPAFASCVQRRSVLQLAPSAGSRALAVGAIASRTAGALASSIPNRASASPIARAPYNRRRTTPRGATVTVAPHFWHSYRRTPTPSTTGGCPTASGPCCVRRRSPCPCICTRPPSGRLGALHAGQCAGRHASHSARFARRLLSAAFSSTVRSLWSFTLVPEHDERRTFNLRSSPCRHPACAPSSSQRTTSTGRRRRRHMRRLSDREPRHGSVARRPASPRQTRYAASACPSHLTRRGARCSIPWSAGRWDPSCGTTLLHHATGAGRPYFTAWSPSVNSGRTSSSRPARSPPG